MLESTSGSIKHTHTTAVHCNTGTGSNNNGSFFGLVMIMITFANDCVLACCSSAASAAKIGVFNVLPKHYRLEFATDNPKITQIETELVL